MTIRLTRRFVIEITSTSLLVNVPYVGQLSFGQRLTPLDRWKALRNTG